MRHRFVRRFLSLGPMGAADIQTVNPGGGAVAGAIPSLTTGANIPAGFIGHEVHGSTVSGSAITLATGTPQNMQFGGVALTGGQWMISWAVDFVYAAATGTIVSAGPGTLTNTLPLQTPASIY